MKQRSDRHFFVLVLFATTLSITIVFWLGAPARFGAHVPQADLVTDYAWGVAVACLCFLPIAMAPIHHVERMALCVIWTIKIAVTLVFMLFYESFYWWLDSYSYYSEPLHWRFSWGGFHVGKGTDNIYNLVWLIQQALPHSFHATKVVFSFVGLWAVFLFYRAAVLAHGRPDKRLLYVLALFPSILFWSSTLGKDPVALLGIGLYAFGVVGWIQARYRWALPMLALGVIVAVLVRPWLGPILVGPLVPIFLLVRQPPITKIAMLLLSAGATVLAFGIVSAQFALETTRDLLESVDATARLWSYGGSGQVLQEDISDPIRLLGAFPLAAFTALFRPLPGEVHNVFGMLAGIENALLLALLATAAVRFRTSAMNNVTIIWALLCVASWTLAYAFVSYQNLGAAVRFRVQILPFMLCALLYFATVTPLRRSPSSVGQRG